MITVRSDYPYAQKPSVTKDLHVFAPTLETLKNQTMLDFELIIVDGLYNQRKDYFKNLTLPFPVKHVPAKPNLWHDVGLSGMATQYNKGVIYADGELLFFTGDSYMFVPDFMKRLWNYFLKGYFPCAWYMRDYGTMDTSDSTFEVHFYSVGTDSIRKAPIPYNMLGVFTGDCVSIEHRYFQAFEQVGRTVETYDLPFEWYFANSSVSLDAMLKINGVDQKFDGGDRSLFDCDMGSRLEMAGYGKCLRMFRNLFVVRTPSDENIYGGIKRGAVSIKCNYGLLGFNRERKMFKANVYELTDKDIEWVKNVWCTQHCSLTESCKKHHPWQFPFEHKSGPKHPPHSVSSKRWFNFWMKHQGLIDLTVERELRLTGNKKYGEGTFCG